MSVQNIKDQSRLDYSLMDIKAGAITFEALQTGALLRIADSLEEMVNMAKEDPTAGNISKLMSIVEAERNGTQ